MEARPNRTDTGSSTFIGPASTVGVAYRECPGHPGYCVGDDGTVWSCRTTGGRTDGPWRQLRTVRSSRYPYVDLCRGDGSYKRKKVHALVLEAFVGPRPANKEARHLNDIPSDNRLSNLRWGFRKENFQDRRVNGIDTRGERCGGAKLRLCCVKAIRRLFESGIECRAQVLGDLFGVSESQARRIIDGASWVGPDHELLPRTKEYRR